MESLELKGKTDDLEWRVTAHEFQPGSFSAVIVVRYPSTLEDLASVIVKAGLAVAMVMSGGDQPETDTTEELIKESITDNRLTTDLPPAELRDC